MGKYLYLFNNNQVLATLLSRYYLLYLLRYPYQISSTDSELNGKNMWFVINPTYGRRTY